MTGAAPDRRLWQNSTRSAGQIVTHNFRPEFINRVDEVVAFHPLGREQIRAITEIQLLFLRNRLID